MRSIRHRHHSRSSKGLWLPVLLGLAACSRTTPPAAPSAPPPQSAAAEWAAKRDGFIEAYFKAQPYFAAQAGRHEFDGQMPDLSAAGIAREIARLHAARDDIAAVDAAALAAPLQFEREYVLAIVDRDLYWLEKARLPSKNPNYYLNQVDPDLYLSRQYAPLDVRLKAYIEYARTIPKIAADMQANLVSPLPRSYVDLGSADFGGLAGFYAHDVAPVFASVQDAPLQAELGAVNAAAAAAMTALKERFERERKTANTNFALGKDSFAEMLRDTERVDLPIATIEAAGRADLARNLAALKAACDRFLPGGTEQACVAKMSAHKMQGGAVEGARAELKVLKQFVLDNRVVSIPSADEALVAEAPPYNRSNSAYMEPPGAYERGVPAVYYISPPDPAWTPAEQAAYLPGYAVLAIMSAHEVWPGHFLQFLHTNANPSKLGGVWVGYAFAEGWAHYAEEMMIERGFGNADPEMHIGEIVDALLRDVRLLSAIGLHTEGMTQAESERMFREQAFQDPGNARQQAARGTYDPAYLNYTLGKLMIRKLRTDWVAQQLAAAGAPPAAPDDPRSVALWHDFHDAFLSYGGPPIPMVRKQMLGDEGSLL